ncbi:hypothetical protein DUI87_35435 [Hirundo rustica rustica]|uniref:Uncharacterized protein n=1 Tax=Hirundo rustica rustica TaxID=333673 RepID=A0A3M0IIS9_HIRRU|nr:hypothetical protein DUI87_35435 [Hirundo rustica rustica]
MDAVAGLGCACAGLVALVLLVVAQRLGLLYRYRLLHKGWDTEAGGTGGTADPVVTTAGTGAQLKQRTDVTCVTRVTADPMVTTAGTGGTGGTWRTGVTRVTPVTR